MSRFVAAISWAGLLTFTACGAGGVVGIGGGVTPTPPAGSHSISGTVSGAAYVTVTLSGRATATGAITATTATTTTDGSGNYTFSGLASGSYTVTPSKAAGYGFSPASLQVTVDGAPVPAQNFATTYSISGCVSGAPSVTVTLTGAASATTTTDLDGNYTFSGLANDSYAVTPSRAGASFSPASRPVLVSGDNVWGENFAATYSISGNVSGAASVRVTLLGAATAASTTTDANGNYSFSGLANGSYTVTPSKSGYGFSPASRSVAVSGASVVSQDFAATYVISGSVLGAPSARVTLTGAASASTTTDLSGNYTFPGLANGSYTVTPSKAGYGFSPASQAVTVNGDNVTSQDFAATYGISGHVSGVTSVGSVTVTLSGAAGASTTTDGSGNYTFSGLASGSYTVRASKAGYGFAPASRSVTVSNDNVTVQDLAATYSISGHVSGVSGASSVTVTLTGTASASTTTDASGNYTFSGLASGSYTVTPSKIGYGFLPASLAVTVNGDNVAAQNITATYGISGTVSGAPSVTVTLLSLSDGNTSASTTTNGSGNYAFPGLADGSYIVRPYKAGYRFTPADLLVTVDGGNVTSQDFAASAVWVAVSTGSVWATATGHAVAVKGDGTLWTWGDNTYGQLGLGSTGGSLGAPRQVDAATDWASASAGSGFTVALKKDGTLWAWGVNSSGQLGDGSFQSHLTPTKVGSGWAKVSAGSAHVVAIKKDGTIWGWGCNYHGELGIGQGLDASGSPEQTGNGTADWASVSAGDSNTFAVKADGSLWGWGTPPLGDGTEGRSWIPWQVGLWTSDWASVSAGTDHTVAVKKDGTLWAWGTNWAGQVGIGTTDVALAPWKVGNEANWRSASSCGWSTLAVRTDGTLWGWGSAARLGGGTGLPDYVLSPAQVGNGTSDWDSVSCSDLSAFALKRDGSLWGWGDNSSGQLGLGTTDAYYRTPQPIRN